MIPRNFIVKYYAKDIHISDVMQFVHVRELKLTSG